MLICTYMVHFEWDERKNRSNLDKHDIDFETAQWIFEVRSASPSSSEPKMMMMRSDSHLPPSGR